MRGTWALTGLLALLATGLSPALAGCRSAATGSAPPEPAWIAKVRAIQDPDPPLGELVPEVRTAPVWVYTPPSVGGKLHVCGVAGKAVVIASQRKEAYADALRLLSEALGVAVRLEEAASGSARIKVRRASAETAATEEVTEAPVVAEWLDERNVAAYGNGIYYMLVAMPWPEGKPVPASVAGSDPHRVPDWIHRVPCGRAGEVYQWGSGGGTLTPSAARRLAIQDAQRRLTQTISYRVTAMSIYQRTGRFELDRSAYHNVVERTVLERAVVVSVWPDPLGLAGLGRGRVFALMCMPTSGLPPLLEETGTEIDLPEKGRPPSWIDTPISDPHALHAFGSHPFAAVRQPIEAFECAVAQAQERLAQQVNVDVTSHLTDLGEDEQRETLSQHTSILLQGMAIVALWADTRGLKGEPRIYVLIKVLLPR